MSSAVTKVSLRLGALLLHIKGGEPNAGTLGVILFKYGPVLSDEVLNFGYDGVVCCDET